MIPQTALILGLIAVGMLAAAILAMVLLDRWRRHSSPREKLAEAQSLLALIKPRGPRQTIAYFRAEEALSQLADALADTATPRPMLAEISIRKAGKHEGILSRFS